MNRSCRSLLVGTCFCLSLASPALAQTKAVPSPSIAEIQSKIRSDDFRVRQEAREKLAELPIFAIEDLRAAEKAESDEEVRASIRNRIAEMELDILVHPPNVQLEPKDYSVGDFAYIINKQLKMNVLQVTGRNDKIRLRDGDVAFWEIMRRFDEELPFHISISARSPKDSEDPGEQFAVHVRQGVKSNSLLVSDGFALWVPKHATSWELPIYVFSDPRVRIAQYERRVDVDRTVSETNENLEIGEVKGTSTIRAGIPSTTSFAFQINLRPDPKAMRIKELSGRITMMIVESERTITFDLRKDKSPPVETAAGTFIIERDAAGNQHLKVDAPKVAGSGVVLSGLPHLWLRYIDKDGYAIRTESYRALPLDLTEKKRFLERFAAPADSPVEVTSVEISFVEKMREYILPVTLKDIILRTKPVVQQPPADR
jgi:hypothetical protein